ncbi:unnamed protein product [Alternaria alternata]|uniref:Extracellular membrane protein CFEM domain-containing protein n=1 Tax=Alternaria tenuissima TaxID=119927 RepID=A0A4Q4M693_9PLEO|nr:hypothetical protein AA0114_g9663 [Alternaria tenuissima]
MKIIQLAAIFGGTALAVQPLAAPHVQRALTDTHSMVVMVTSTHLVSEICTDIASCPPYTTTAQTSVVYVTATTTICLLSSTPPGYGPPATTVNPSSVASSTYPTESAGITVSTIPGSSISPTGSEYLSGSAPQSSALPTDVSSSAYVTVPSVSVITRSESYNGPVVVTLTSVYPGSSVVIVIPSSTTLDVVNSFYSGSPTTLSPTGSSTGYVAPPDSSLVSSLTIPAPVVPSSSAVSSMSYPGSVPSGSSATPSYSNTDAVPTSLVTPSLGPSSGNSVTPSTPGYAPSSSATPPSSNTDAVPTSLSATVTDSSSSGYNVPSSISTKQSGSYVGTVPTTFTVSLPTGPSSSGYAMSSSKSAISSSPAGLSSSGYIVPPGSSDVLTSSGTAVLPSSPTASLPSASSAGPSSSRLLTGSETDAVPTSFPSGGPSAGPSSGSYFVSSGTASGSSGTGSGTYPARTSATSGYPNPSHSAGSDSTVTDSTIRITSYQTQTFTSYVTAGPSSNGAGNNTNTDTQAVATSFPSSVSGYPSGSGYPHPSSGINGTIIAPSPSYIEVPINTGHIVGVGKSSLTAIVVALVFVHLA